MENRNDVTQPILSLRNSLPQDVVVATSLHGIKRLEKRGPEVYHSLMHHIWVQYQPAPAYQLQGTYGPRGCCLQLLLVGVPVGGPL